MMLTRKSLNQDSYASPLRSVETMIPAIPVVILAAGESRRLGAAKQLVRFRGQTLLARAVATAQASSCGPVFVVLGSGLDALWPEVAESGARLVANPAWAEGMGSSVRAGVQAIEAAMPDAAAILLTLCDQPLVTPALLAQVVEAYRRGHGLVAAAYGDVLGVPALFARRYFAELIDLAGDTGARRLLAQHAAEVFAVPFPAGSIDVDTPADVARLNDLRHTWDSQHDET